jgi:hypothetical protein
MPIEILVPILVWILMGVVCAVWIFLDMRKNGEMQWPWLITGLLLSIVGIILFHFLVRKKRAGYQYPPKPEYDSPQYNMKGDPDPKGADPKSESKLTLTAVPRPLPNVTPKPAPSAASMVVPSNRTTPMGENRKVVDGKRVAKHTEGIPRCDQCGMAVSSHDLSCPGCGTNLK